MVLTWSLSHVTLMWRLCEIRIEKKIYETHLSLTTKNCETHRHVGPHVIPSLPSLFPFACPSQPEREGMTCGLHMSVGATIFLNDK